ncbi:uncharacterized protein CMU_006480 [Cryptosporidium muris RN66]|uniref:HTH OST-type domain-containing protein n=1 Tax=Cryptosporidium muris (strain RN66) TaxID=441375 RepID=B6AHN0_CRYMR|nr:uncharacterized protein CMU_006480 [Cryptosporidium muris RN66]EEA07725.1 hypothetical protein, conserved [Cryptosporidium muris RN66]|eukprot:XP_002142074.1 hypothetical protein [Cryptosporidium muris RN66]
MDFQYLNQISNRLLLYNNEYGLDDNNIDKELEILKYTKLNKTPINKEYFDSDNANVNRVLSEKLGNINVKCFNKIYNNKQEMQSFFNNSKLNGTLQQIRDALNSLYIDQTRPHIQELLRRIQERSTESFRNMKFGTKELLNELYIHKDEFFVSESGEVYFTNNKVEESHWIDPKNPEDPYSPSIWKAFMQYIHNLIRIGNFNPHFSNSSHIESDKYQLNNNSGFSYDYLNYKNNQVTPILMRYQFKGGRYGVAIEIHKANIPELKDLSVGQICHLVQLAISKGILQYENNVLQPRCTCLKIAAAVLALDIEKDNGKFDKGILNKSFVFNDRKNSSSSITTTDTEDNSSINTSPYRKSLAADIITLRKQIQRILRDYPEGILLSLLKKYFVSCWNTKLCPTVYGYTRISALLLSDNLKDICRLYVDSKNHVLVQSTNYQIPENVRFLEEEKSNKNTASIDLELLQPNQAMYNITFEYMKALRFFNNTIIYDQSHNNSVNKSFFNSQDII